MIVELYGMMARLHYASERVFPSYDDVVVMMYYFDANVSIVLPIEVLTYKFMF